MNPPFDRRLLRIRRNRAARAFHRHDFLFREVGERLAERLAVIRRPLKMRLELGARTGVLHPLLAGPGTTLVQCELAEHMLLHGVLPHEQQEEQEAGEAGSTGTGTGTRVRLGVDEEFLPFGEGSFDAVFSVFSLHSVNDLPGCLAQIRRILVPDGLFLAALPGGETLQALRICLAEAESRLMGGISPRVFPFADHVALGGLLMRAGFQLPTVDRDVITVRYRDLWHLMADLRGMGETSMLEGRSRHLTPPGLFRCADRLWHERFGSGARDGSGHIEARFHIHYLTGWKPHDSQPKPLRPGEFRHHLGDHLAADPPEEAEEA